MARRRKGESPAPFFKKSHKSWYLKLKDENGKRIDYRLGPDKVTAWQEYHKLMASHVDTENPENQGWDQLNSKLCTVRELITGFLEWSKITSRKEGTHKHYETYLSGKRGFSEYVSRRMRVSEVRPHHVHRFIEQHYPDIGPTTTGNLIGAVKRPFKWAEDEGYLQYNPLKGLKKPKGGGRGGVDGVYVPPEEFAELLEKISDENFRDYCEFMYETGCRAEEINIIQSTWFHSEEKMIVIPKELAKGYKRKRMPKDRIILLNEQAEGIAAKNHLKHPEGNLFRNLKGGPWKRHAVACRFQRMKKAVGKCYVATWFRHSFITNALINKVPIFDIAKMVGHTDTSMIMQVYEHHHLTDPEFRISIDQATAKPKKMPTSTYA